MESGGSMFAHVCMVCVLQQLHDGFVEQNVQNMEAQNFRKHPDHLDLALEKPLKLYNNILDRRAI